MKTVRLTLAALAVAASATAAFADPEASADRNAFYANLAGQPAQSQVVVEGRQAAVRTETVHQTPALSEADALRLQMALDRDRSTEEH